MIDAVAVMQDHRIAVRRQHHKAAIYPCMLQDRSYRSSRWRLSNRPYRQLLPVACRWPLARFFFLYASPPSSVTTATHAFVVVACRLTLVGAASRLPPAAAPDALLRLDGRNSHALGAEIIFNVVFPLKHVTKDHKRACRRWDVDAYNAQQAFNA